MTAKTVAIGVELVLVAMALSLTGAVADEGDEIGRYVIVPMPGREALILLDTKTGQNWIYTTKNFTWQPNPFAKRLFDPPPPEWAYLPTPPPASTLTDEQLLKKFR